jgi:plasmid stabilization system protein ParE
MFSLDQPGALPPAITFHAFGVRTYSYRIIFRVQGKTVTIVAVIHGKRMLEDVQPAVNP